ncbi:MAG: hypothetical protein FJ225_02155 [Lentisphaerae bacterium]|nr:hypothetical protein [Lentisphaerota bacterium]
MSARSALVFKCRRSAVNLGRILREQSSLKFWFILLFALLMESGLFFLFLDGFRFFAKIGGAGGILIDRLFGVFFLGMGAMLAVSGVVSAYSTIFRSEEIPFLLVHPFRMSAITVYKFLESTAFSSWAFFIIVIPFAGAYAVHQRMSLLFALWAFVFSAPFLVLCSAVGALFTFLLVRWFPRARLLQWCAAAVIAAAAFILWRWRSSIPVLLGAGHTTFALTRLVPGFTAASNPLLPNWWIAEGILTMARGGLARGALLLATLVSWACLGVVLVEWLGGRLFYPAWERSAGGASARHAPFLLNGISRRLAFLPGDVRGVLAKDLRSFLRDPLQWSQALIFFGLLALYFANLRTFRYHVLPDVWRSAISLLNVFSVSAVMCSLGSRFVYPQLSLEGQAFWVVGLSPARLGRILLTKFLSSALGLTAVTVSLTMLSGAMLHVAWVARVTAVALASAVTLAVCGLSTGLGAVFLDLRQSNPAAIVSGFGGTLNLVLSLAFMLAAIVPFGALFHWRAVGSLTPFHFRLGLAAASAWLLALTALATALPLRLAARSLARREF